MDEMKKCSKCKIFSAKSIFLRIERIRMVTDRLVRFAVKSIFLMIKIKYLTIIKFLKKTIDQK